MIDEELNECIKEVCFPPYTPYDRQKFIDIYADAQTFITDVKASGLNIPMTDESLTTTYWLLIGRYGSEKPRAKQLTQFKASLFSVLYSYGPSWEKRIEIQTKVRGLTEADILAGGKAIYNTASNPASEPSTGSLEELTYIDNQNTTNYKKSKLEGYQALLNMLENDLSADYIAHFKSLFNPFTDLYPSYELSEE